MSIALRRLQWLGIALIAISAALPALAWRIGTPRLAAPLQPGPERVVLVGPPGPQRAPAAELGYGIAKWAQGEGPGALWARRPVYAYGLLPFWILGLLWAGRRPRAAGLWLWAVTLGLIGLEARYLESDYLPFFPQILGSLETGIAWCVVCALLVYRRGPDRRLEAVQSTIAAHGLLAVVHGLTLPCTLVRDEIGHEALSRTLERIGDAFAPGFWLGMVGFVLVAVPGYVGGRAAYNVSKA